jgi:hypothetical protein
VGVWNLDPNNWRLEAPARGNPDEAIYYGGWRCAGAMDPYFRKQDHTITSPFYNTGEGEDTRHSCWCRDCAKEFFGESPPSNRGT